MRQGMRLPSPALVLAGLALFVALGGTVYAAKKGRLDGKAVKVKSLPGNRVKPHSIPTNRLNASVLKKLASVQSGQVTGAEINELTLAQVPEAAHATEADTAKSATDAQTALSAVNAVNAQTLNGHGAGCLPGTRLFAGACWQASFSETAVSAPAAATSCAVQGGTLPEALQLAAFSQQPGVSLHEGGEWTSDIPVVSSPGLYGVVTVSASGEVASTASSNTRRFRCVIPLVT
jgi:microcystin-dependent protein